MCHLAELGYGFGRHLSSALFEIVLLGLHLRVNTIHISDNNVFENNSYINVYDKMKKMTVYKYLPI